MMVGTSLDLWVPDRRFDSNCKPGPLGGSTKYAKDHVDEMHVGIIFVLSNEGCKVGIINMGTHLTFEAN